MVHMAKKRGSVNADTGSEQGQVAEINHQEIVGGDKISVGNISDSYTAIGAGAQVIVNQIQQTLSAVDELEKGIQAAERRLAESIQKKLQGYTQLKVANDIGTRGNPYKALLDYKLEDAPFFYGRAAAIKAMQGKMQQSRLTIGWRILQDSAPAKNQVKFWGKLRIEARGTGRPAVSHIGQGQAQDLAGHSLLQKQLLSRLGDGAVAQRFVVQCVFDLDRIHLEGQPT